MIQEFVNSRKTRQLEILALRCLELADQVAAGQLLFLDASRPRL